MSFFYICIFLSAFLLFQVEPMIAKYLLPWFGGTPAVWSTVMMFFQLMLTGGYAYAYWLIGKARRKEIMHVILLVIALILLAGLWLVWKSPITPGIEFKPAGSGSPILEISKLLLISVGLPFFLLASNSPLIQAWFSQIYPGRPAYRLYALSNAGSLVGLITYPVFVEPNLTLSWQGRVWALGFAIYAGLAAYGVFNVLRRRGAPAPDPDAAAIRSGPRPKASAFILWILLSAGASVLLLATTNQITQEVAVIPFLWVLPLTIYLLTFILAFSDECWYSREIFLGLFFVTSILVFWALGRSADLGIWPQIAIYSSALFAACMVCHGELYRLRPHPLHLTSFYLMVSVGGALGGVVINFVAPYVFKGYWELPLGFALCWLLFMVSALHSRAGFDSHWKRVVQSAALLSMFILACVRSYMQIRSDQNDEVVIQRNFYGVIRVKRSGFTLDQPLYVDAIGKQITAYQRMALIHGVTIHGFQLQGQLLKDLPTAYYSPTGGGGLAILNHPDRGRGMRVGVLGLGIGTLAAYGQPGDVYRFYEINPAVIQLAEGAGGYFSYLSDSRADVQIVPGDARLSLEAELAEGHPQNYDVLVLDVFSSDSIPVHLLDREAFGIYLRNLQPEGILAAHISNIHLDLIPIVWTLADYYHLSSVLIKDTGDGAVSFPSIWVLMATDPSVLRTQAIASRAADMTGYSTRLRIWTDDYNDLIQILK